MRSLVLLYIYTFSGVLLRENYWCKQTHKICVVKIHELPSQIKFTLKQFGVYLFQTNKHLFTRRSHTNIHSSQFTTTTVTTKTKTFFFLLTLECFGLCTHKKAYRHWLVQKFPNESFDLRVKSHLPTLESALKGPKCFFRKHAKYTIVAL